MAPSARSTTESPSTRAALARKKLNILPDNEIVYVDRLGPRILCVPPDPTVRLSRETLRELDKGNLTGHLGRGARFLSKRMMQCPEITIDTNGHYTVQKKKNDPNGRDSRAFTIQTLDVWTGKLGELHEDRDIDDLIFYSMGADLLPSYHSWKGERLIRRESSLELERQHERTLAENELAECPKPVADVIDEYKEEQQAKMDEEASNDPENMLRFKPKILPSDPAWEGVEEYFKWNLHWEREENPDAPHVHRVLRDELVESQQLLAILAANSGYRAKIQDENTEKYHEALRTTFQGKPDNLVTKLTMVCFGLPIEPLTMANVKFAGGLEDVPAEDSEDIEKGLEGQIIERIVWSEKPLEFLDYYNERSYGYPMIRTQKRKYEEIDAETVEKLLAQAQEWAKHPRLIWDGCGFPEMDESEQDLHLRGSAENPVEVQRRNLWLYTEMGRFYIDDLFGTFEGLTNRLFRLENIPRWRCQVDMIPVVHTDSGVKVDETGTPKRWIWNKTSKYNRQPDLYNWFIQQKLDDNDKWIVRLRYVGRSVQHGDPAKFNPTDAWEPVDDQTLVNLEIQGVGIAYWYLPANEPYGVNVLQDTFRNTIECLIPQHRQYHVQWTIPGKPSSSGQLQLIAEAPSKALWIATQEALKSRPRVTIYLTVLEDKPNPLSVKILMPGFNSVGWYNRLPDDQLSHQNREIFEAIRNFARPRTEPNRTPLRIWSGVENYDSREILQDPLSMVLPAEKDPGLELDIWMREYLAFTFDTVVVRPEFEEYRIICMMDHMKEDLAYENCPSKILAPWQGYVTLERFRRAVRQLLGDFNPGQEYIAIEQPQSDQTFLIGPDMTELQWRFHVFDWLDNSTIFFRRHQAMPSGYATDFIQGPMEPTSNLTAARRTPNPLEGEDEQPPEEGTVPIITEPVTTQPRTTLLGNTPTENSPIDGNLLLTTEETYSTWRQKQDAAEQLRLEAYTGNQSIHQPGQDPQIPQFGPAFEGNIPVAGRSFPTIFTGMSTPTENVERDREARDLLNIVLERQDFCGVCQTALPARAHNAEERERHYQEHRNIETEARRNALGSFATVAQGPVREVFYCEYCGKTPAEFERENNREKHGSACANKATFNDVPQYCQYCRLNFWDNDMTNETVKGHVQNCANNRRVSPQGQISLYQHLLSRSVGRRQPDGVSRCHFAGCRQIFNSATTNLARANHFLTHIDHNDVEKLYCPLEDCNFAFTGLTQQGIVAHLKTHFGSGNDGPNPTSHLCPFEDCVDDMTSWTDQRRIQHMIRHLTQNGSIPPWPSPNCPFENCSRNFTDMSREEMTEHLHTHDTDHRGTSCLLCRQSWLGIDPEEIIEHFVTKHTHLRCQWPSCDHRYAPEAAVDDRRVHLRTHLSDQDIPTPSGIVPQTHLGCQMCSKRLKNNTKSIAKHYTTHIRDMFCTWLGCLHQYAEAATDDDRRAHLQTHMSLDCQWPGCNHIYVQSPTDDDITLHLLTHMPAKGGATRPPPVEPQGPDPPGDNPAAVDRGNNNIPQRLKDANPGMNFYCPSCFMLVSGKNPSACKRHRGSKCKVQGHGNWIIATAGDLKKMKESAAKEGRGKRAVPKTKDPAYRPGDDPPEEEGEELTEESEPPVSAVGSKGKGKRQAGGGAGDRAGRSKKKQKK